MILTKRLILYLTAAFILAGCGPARPPTPLTPEEQEAREIRSHCLGLAKVEANKFDALVGPGTGGSAFGGAARAFKKSQARNAYYRECMYRYGHRP